ncbi:MAG: branched-chain amino acid ABC transporter permease [Acidimicrobiales bacterium]
MSEIVEALFSGLATGSLFALSGIGIVVIFRVTKLVNFAQGVFPVFAGFVMFSLLQTHLPWVAAGVVAAVVSALLGVVLGWCVLLRRVKSALAAVFILLGLAIVLEGVFVLGWGDQPISYQSVVSGTIHVAGTVVEPEDLVLIVVTLLSVAALQLFFARTYLGKAMTAAAANYDASKLVGISLLSVGSIAFALSGLLGGIAGVLSTSTLPITYTSDVLFTVYAFAAAIVGNLESPVGTLVGGLVLGELEAFVSISSFASYAEVVALVGLLVVLVARSGSTSSWFQARRSLH